MATKDTDDRPVVEQLPAGGETVNKDISRQRRKIIKASAAAIPAIMTLRSGAAAAMNSSYQCFNHGENAANVDLVLGDEAGERLFNPPHDEWLRMSAIPGFIVEYDSTTYYGVKNTEAAWDNEGDWTWYYLNNSNGNLSTKNSNSNPIKNGWDSKTAFYCILGTLGVATVYLDEDGVEITGIPGAILTVIEASKIFVYLLCYYNPDNGDITYHPMPRGDGVSPITESCMCSIRPVLG
jgi:hypothetical protein